METARRCRRRKIGATRFHVNIDVHISSPSAGRTAREGLGVVRNLSMRGALIETHLSVETSDHVKLDVTLPNQSDLLTINEAVIRWTRGGQVGVEFLKLPPGTSRRLMMFLASVHSAAQCQREAAPMTMLTLASEDLSSQHSQSQ